METQACDSSTEEVEDQKFKLIFSHIVNLRPVSLLEVHETISQINKIRGICVSVSFAYRHSILLPSCYWSYKY